MIYNRRRHDMDGVIAIYPSSGIKRPVHDADRTREMSLTNA